MKPLGDTIRSVSWEELPPSVRSIPENFDPLAEGVLMKHQREWVSIKAKIKLCAKGRRTGITFAEALEKSIRAASRKEAGGSNVFYIPDAKEKGLEFIGYCAKFLRIIAEAQAMGVSSIEEFIFEDQNQKNGETRKITAWRIRLASGFQIVALSSRPASLRGLQGIVIIDEAAFHQDVQAVLDAATALLIWGGELVLISSHNGKKNPFYQMQEDILAGRYGENAVVMVITFDDAVANGLYERVSEQSNTRNTLSIASIQKYGVISENKSYAGIPTASLAARLAARDLKPSQAGIKKFKLVFDRRAYTLQPMSVFKVSSPERGIDSIVLRAIRVEHNNITNGEITVTAIQDVFGLPATSYIKDQPSLWQPPVSTALNITNPLIYEIPFYELVEDFSVTDLQLKNNQGYFAVVAQQPTPLHISFDLLAKASTETSYINSGTSDFAFISSIASSIPQTASAVTCVLNDLIENVEIGDRALLGSEIVRVTAIDINLNSVTLARGCIDTLPVSHAAGTKFYIYSNLNNAINRLFSMNQTANFKFITSTSSDELDENLATAYTAILSNRLSRPYPPANVRLNNAFFPVSTDVSNGLSISWQPRNRLTQVALAPSFLDASTASEDNSTYNIRVYDANNVQLLDRQNVESPYIWNVPRRFIGDLETTLHIPMTGTNNSRNFSDISANTHPVTNDGVIIKTDTAANGGSAAFFDTLMMQSSAHWSLSAVEDHTLEARVKTPTANLTANQDSGTWVITVGAVDGISSEKYHINFLYNFSLGTMKLGIQGNYLNPIGNQLEVVNYSIEFAIGQNTYFDFAVEKIGDHLDIYIDGTKNGECNLSVLDAGTGSLKFIKLTAWQAKSSFMINGLRMTKRNGGRYGANYTPSAFVVGGSDPYWSNVVLLIRMLGPDNSASLTDSSINGLTITNTATIMIKTDATARGGSAARFCVPMLRIQNHTALRDKNFVIEFRAKFLSDNLSMTIFNLIESMRLDFLTLKNFDPTSGFTEILDFDLATNIVDGNYHDVKIERDASTGIVRFSFDDLFVDGTLNAT